MKIDMNKLLNSKNPWKEACQYELNRNGETLELGVNFFILALEKLDAKTHFSCEGHPRGFYIVFECSYDTALFISTKLKFFNVQIFRGNEWKMSLEENVFISGEQREFTEKNRVEWLTNAANYWSEIILKNYT